MQVTFRCIPSRASVCVLAAAMTFLIAGAPAQTRQSDNLRLTALKFSGLRIFSEKQAAAGSGLRVGEPVTVAQLSVAANQLAQSGAFEKVAFQYSTQGNGLTAIFTVVESKNLLPCLFDNFVWFSDDQLDKTLRARVPFYAGVAPVSGASQRQIVDTLRALLQSNGITGDVQGLPFADHGGAVKAISFRVLGVPMPIETVNFPGSSAISEKDLETASSQVMGEDFSITNMTEFASVGLVPLYRQKGYLRAAFDRPQWAVIGNPSQGSSPDIALTLSVKEGAQYFWDKVAWSGNTQLTKGQLEQALSMKHGDIANEQKIDDGFKAIRKSYDKLGYIEASVQPKVDLDDSKLMAAYEVTIDEGAQFHMGQLRLSGIPDKAASDLMAKWQLKPGSVYDGTYAMEYVNKIAMQRLFEMGIRVKSVNFKSQPDKQNATVDVQVAFQ